MVSETVSDWRAGVRFRIDGQQWHYDGIGEHSRLHATAFQYSDDGKRYWKNGQTWFVGRDWESEWELPNDGSRRTVPRQEDLI